MNLSPVNKNTVNTFFLAMLFLVAFGSSVASAQNEDAEITLIRTVLTNTQPNMQIHSIEPSPIEGMYQVVIQNMQTIYATADASYFIPGDLFETIGNGNGLVNHGEQLRNQNRVDQLALIDESEMIIFEPEGERLATLSVFTDLDCPYCRRLHGEIEALNQMGIAVRYLAFPRQGLEGETYEKMVSTWCSENPEMYLTSAKRGGDVPSATCNNPIAKHHQLGRELGVQGTPALILEDGYIINGYVPAETLRGYMLGDAG